MSDSTPWLERASALAPLIQSCADESERERRLATPVVDAVHDAGLFRLQVPRRFGGAGLDPIEALPVYEEVAAADGSAGWNLAIGAGGGAFAAMLDDADALEEIVGAPRALIAGSVNPMALRVVPEADGYRVSGRLRYASGVSQSSWLMAGGILSGSVLERCWRDAHAVTRHIAISPSHLERLGRITLGLDPGPGPI